MTTSKISNLSTKTSLHTRRKATWRFIFAAAKFFFSWKGFFFSIFVVVASWACATESRRASDELEDLRTGTGTNEDPYVRMAVAKIEEGSDVDTQFKRLQTLIKKDTNKVNPTCVASYQS